MWDMCTDTPLPQEEPAGENPPDGLIVDYFLKSNVNGEVTLEILDNEKRLIRKFSTKDTQYKIPPVNIPLYWIRPQETLQGTAGSHRFVWDLHYTPLNLPPAFPISAIYGNTAPSPTSPWVMPAKYFVKLTVEDKSIIQSFTVKMDPRVKTSLKDLQQQHDLSFRCYEDRLKLSRASDQLQDITARIKDKLLTAGGNDAIKLREMEKEVTALRTPLPGNREATFSSVSGALASVFSILQRADVAATSQAIIAADESHRSFEVLWQKSEKLLGKAKNILPE
jgi:hypothetical protein